MVRCLAVVFSAQISDHLSFSRDDPDEVKVTEIGEILSVGDPGGHAPQTRSCTVCGAGGRCQLTHKHFAALPAGATHLEYAVSIDWSTRLLCSVGQGGGPFLRRPRTQGKPLLAALLCFALFAGRQLLAWALALLPQVLHPSIDCPPTPPAHPHPHHTPAADRLQHQARQPVGWHRPGPSQH